MLHQTGRQVRRTAIALLLGEVFGGWSPQKDGFLAVIVTLGEARTPLTSASVFVRGYRHVYLGDLSSSLEQTKPGVFGAALPEGVYDVFVSDAGTLPICRRVAIVSGHREDIYANLKLDMEHMEK